MSAPPVEFGGTARFRVRARLGQGALGVVYEAQDTERQETCAIKTLRWLQPDTLLLLKNEFRTVHDIAHPNLVKLGELIEDQGTWFFTMEFIRGVRFSAYVRPDDPSARATLPPPAAGARPAALFREQRLRHALVQLARGVHALHAAKKVHCDLKPSNVLVTADGRVVVLDFGIVRDLARGAPTDDEGITGTAHYMAPEQAASEAVGPAADWYAVGCMLYQALTGRLPFEGPTVRVLEDKLVREPPRPSEIVDRVPRDLDELCASMLRTEPGDRPTDEQILRRLGDEAAPEAARAAAPGAEIFVGREGELAVLAAAWTDARARRAVTLSVHGESGVGKSFLVHEFAARVAAREPSLLVLRGRCFERESVPFKAVDGLVDRLASFLEARPPEEVAALLPADAGALGFAFPVLRKVPLVGSAMKRASFAGPQQQRTAVFVALRGLFSAIARRWPLLVVIEDLQWADVDSAALLDEVMAPPGAPPLLLLLTTRLGTETTRKGAPGSQLAPARLRGDVRHLQVEALPRADARARVARLDGGARRLLELVCVAGLPIRHDVAARAAALDLASLYALEATLKAANLVLASGVARTDDVEVYHHRVREALLPTLDTTARREWHSRLALALEGEAEVDPELLATHWAGAERAARAADYAEKGAAQALASLAFGRAARLYRMALDLVPRTGQDAARLHAGLGDALALMGRGVDAAEAYRAAAGFASDPLPLRQKAADQLMRVGHLNEGLAETRWVLRRVGLSLPRSLLVVMALVLGHRFVLFMRGLSFRERPASAIPSDDLVRIDVCQATALALINVAPVPALEIQLRALRLALRAGEPGRVGATLRFEAAFRAARGVPGARDTERVLGLQQALAERRGVPFEIALVKGIRGTAAFLSGQFRTAHARLVESLETLASTPGSAWELATMGNYLVWTLAYLGRFAEVERLAKERYRQGLLQGDFFTATCMAAGGYANLAWLVTNEPAAARREADAAIALWSRDHFHVEHFWHAQALAHVDLYEGDAAAAHARIAACWPDLRRTLALSVQHVRQEAVHLRARAAVGMAAAAPAGARGRLLRAVRRDVRRLLRERGPYSRPYADALDAATVFLGGDRARAAELLGRAADGFERAGMQGYAEAARRRRGEIAGGAEGAALVARADAAMRAQGVARPERFAAMFLPGFDGTAA